MLGLLVVVWLNLALQACAAAAPDADMPADRTTVTSSVDLHRTHSGHTQPEQCPFCPGCEDDGCAEQGPCDGPVVAGTKAEFRLPENFQFETPAAVAVVDLDLAVNSLETSPMRPGNRAVAAAVSFYVQYCVYLI